MIFRRENCYPVKIAIFIEFFCRGPYTFLFFLDLCFVFEKNKKIYKFVYAINQS